MRNVEQVKVDKFFLLRLLFIMPIVLLLNTAETLAEQPEEFRGCAACHLPSAKGVAGMFPPLTGRLGSLANSSQGRDYLVMVIEAGLMGSLTIEGAVYRGVMPPQGAGLGDQGIAVALNYLLQEFNAESLGETWNPFTPKEVSHIKARYPQASGQDVYRLRQKVFENKQ